MTTAYSVQQIKFELVSYVKEFGADFTDWTVGTTENAAEALFETHKIDPARDLWFWKPALTPGAARLVRDWVVGRYGARAAAQADGPNLFMFKAVTDRT